MKAHLQKLVGLAALGMTLVTTPVVTWAGYQFTPGVAIYPNQVGGTYAKGSMVGARYSEDPRQYIQCAIEEGTGGNSRTRCWARDSAARTFYCESSDPKFKEVVQAMTDSSSIYIWAGNNGIVCTDIRIYNGSDRLR
jgi:hypothetical protein